MVIVFDLFTMLSGEMSNAEIMQCILDIKSWFLRGKCAKNINDGATSADLQRLQKATDMDIPRALNFLLTEMNGGIYFMDKELMGTGKIIEVFSEIESSRKWKAGCVPFCGDDCTMLAIDTRTDEVLEWDSDEGFGDVVAPNLMRYLEDYRNSLLGGKFEFLDEVGVVEKMSAVSKQSRK